MDRTNERRYGGGNFPWNEQNQTERIPSLDPAGEHIVDIIFGCISCEDHIVEDIAV